MSQIDETLALVKDLHSYSIINSDDYYSEKLLQVIITLSTLNLTKGTDSKLSNDEKLLQDEIAKVKRKVPKWMKKTHQYNYQILKAFMKLSDNNANRIEVEALEKYVDIGQAFLANYNNLKTISEKNHGKVFEEIDREVELWEPVAEAIEGIFMYNKYFSQFLMKSSNQNNYLSFNHSDNKSYISKKYKGFGYGAVLVSSRAKAYGSDFTGLIVELYIDGENYNELFGKLSQYKNEIESKFIDINIVWQKSSETQSGNVCRVYAKKDVDINDVNKWGEYIDWQVNTLIQFLEIFPEYTQSIDSQIKIGKYVKERFKYLLENNLLSKDILQNLQDNNFVKQKLNMNYPVLKKINNESNIMEECKVNGHPRYYTKAIRDYLLSNDWYERNRNLFDEWLNNLDYKRDVK